MATRTGKSGQKRAKRGDVQTLAGAIRVVSDVLSAPRDRLGRLDFAAADKSREARETLRLLAEAYSVPGCIDVMEQCEKVLRAALWRVETGRTI